MARIVCFSDTAGLSGAVRHALGESGHDLHTLPASLLTAEVRAEVRALAPDLILLELTRAHDNAHLLFFLRSERSTRSVPIILLSDGARLDQHAAVLEADGYLQRPFEPDRLHALLERHLLPREAMAAA